MCKYSNRAHASFSGSMSAGISVGEYAKKNGGSYIQPIWDTTWSKAVDGSYESGILKKLLLAAHLIQFFFRI